MLRFQTLINISYLLILFININLLEIFSSSDVNLYLFISSFAVFLSSIFSGIFASSTIPIFISNKDRRPELIFAALFITTFVYLILSSITLFISSFSENIFLFFLTMINSYLVSIFALFSNISYSEKRMIFPVTVQILSLSLVLIVMNFLENLWLYVALHSLFNLIANIVLIKKLNIFPRLNFHKNLYKKLISSWSSIMMSSSFSRFDIVQDRFILSSLGSIPAYHYSRVIVDVFNLLLTRAYLIKDLIDSSNSKKEINNYFFVAFIVLISLFFAYFNDLVNLFTFLNLEIFKYLDGFAYLYLFAISAFSSSLFVNKFYANDQYWTVSIPSTIISSIFILIKLISSGLQVEDLLIFLSLRAWLNFIFLSLLFATKKQSSHSRNIFPLITIFIIGVIYIHKFIIE